MQEEEGTWAPGGKQEGDTPGEEGTPGEGTWAPAGRREGGTPGEGRGREGGRMAPGEGRGTWARGWARTSVRRAWG